MYVPAHFAADPEVVAAMLARPGGANLVTATADGLMATFLPWVYDAAGGPHGVLQGHLARNNPQALTPVTGEALVIIAGRDAYITPSWYPSKAEHGRVVPTWNYGTVHVYGDLVVHDDPVWVEGNVRALTELYESTEARPWSVDDAPYRYVSGQLNAIVGVEVMITRIEAKQKMSQNRPLADAEGVVAGLHARGDHDLAEQVAQAQARRKR